MLRFIVRLKKKLTKLGSDNRVKAISKYRMISTQFSIIRKFKVKEAPGITDERAKIRFAKY